MDKASPFIITQMISPPKYCQWILNQYRNSPFMYVCLCQLRDRRIPTCAHVPANQKTGSIAAVYFWMFKHRWNALHLCFSGVEERESCGFFRQQEKEGSSGTGNTDRFPRWEALLACHGFTEEKHNELCWEEAQISPPEFHRPAGQSNYLYWESIVIFFNNDFSAIS